MLYGVNAFDKTVVYLLPSRWPTTITCPNLYSAFSHHWLRKGFDLLRLHARLSAVDLIIRIINCPLKHFTPVRWGLSYLDSSFPSHTVSTLPTTLLTYQVKTGYNAGRGFEGFSFPEIIFLFLITYILYIIF